MATLIPHETVAIGVGAVCGALTRYQCGRVFGEWIASDPNLLKKQGGGLLQPQNLTGWHTALINVGGSFLLGGVAAAPSAVESSSSAKPSTTHFSTFGLSPRVRLLLGVGFCGSFTTFSTYSVDIATWIAQGHTAKALSYVMVNNVGGVVAAAAGMALVRKLFG